MAGIAVSTMLIALQHARSPVYPLTLSGYTLPLYIGLLGLLANVLTLMIFEVLLPSDPHDAELTSICGELHSLFD